MRLAYFSPLPPVKSGIADYSAELLPELAKGAEITVFVDQPRDPKPGLPYDVQPAIYFDEIDRDRPFDLCIYQQGNNQHHEFVYDQALRVPGMLVLHEYCL
ncbi:MAG: glycosyl transferase family 1, partial [Blastocatellia bacterium]